MDASTIHEAKPHDQPAANSALSAPTPTADDGAIDLALIVRDPEVVRYLRGFVEGDARDRAALAALRVGVLAIAQATGTIDAAALRGEGDRLIAGVRGELDRHGEQVASQLAAALRQYLDPTDGHLPMRLNEVLRPDGQLDQLLRRHVGADNSTMAQALARQVGEASPVFKLLNPQQQDGLVASLKTAIKEALDEQSRRVTGQFSLNDPQSALSVFKGQLTEVNGKLRKELADDVQRFQREFDLGNADGALARLVQRVEEAQKRITGEFTLDNQASALSKLKGEIVGLLSELRDRNTQFQQDVKAAVESLKAVRGERERNTAGGQDFESALCELLASEAGRLGDQFEAVGATPGEVPRSKKGDAVIVLGAETAAAGRRIVIEAKRQAKNLAQARAELEEARRNRAADIGIFVFASASAGGLTGVDSFCRHGDDLVVVWDPEDRTTDVYVKAAVSVARALVVRRKIESEAAHVDLGPVEAACEMLEKAGKCLGVIANAATLSISHSQKVLEQSEKMKGELALSAERLTGCLDKLRAK
ncbi:MAG: hypothetical protein AMXMBFR58_26940 [Phycisphaerae bacterium]|nr:hypothetical protein [Phycisphaerales bacterium]